MKVINSCSYFAKITKLFEFYIILTKNTPTKYTNALPMIKNVKQLEQHRLGTENAKWNTENAKFVYPFLSHRMPNRCRSNSFTFLTDGYAFIHLVGMKNIFWKSFLIRKWSTLIAECEEVLLILDILHLSPATITLIIQWINSPCCAKDKSLLL